MQNFKKLFGELISRGRSQCCSIEITWPSAYFHVDIEFDQGIADVETNGIVLCVAVESDILPVDIKGS